MKFVSAVVSLTCLSSSDFVIFGSMRGERGERGDLRPLNATYEVFEFN